MFLLLVLARHLPTTTTTAASFPLSRRLCLPSQPQAVARTPSIREESASESASLQGSGRAGESEKLRARGLRRKARWDNESFLQPASSRPCGLLNYNSQPAFRAPKPGPGALPSEGLARRNRRARWEGSGSGGKAEPLASLRGSVVSPGKTTSTRSTEREAVIERGGLKGEGAELRRGPGSRGSWAGWSRVEPGGASAMGN